MESLSALLASPLMPVLILWAGPVLLSFVSPAQRHPGLLRFLTLMVMGLGMAGLISLDFLPGVPQYVWLWRPEFQMLWIHLSWNWAVALLVGLLGLTGILLSGHVQTGPFEDTARFLYGRFLAVNLATVAVTLMLVNSANILALVFMWVAFDVLMIIRQTLVAHQHQAVQHDYSLLYHRSLGLSLLGSLVLLVGLFPAGEFGPKQMLTGSVLPPISLYALLLAAVLRAGVYPLHLWLLPSSMLHLTVAERIFSQILPGLTGIWLLGFTLDLAQRHPDVVPLIAPWIPVAFCLAGISCLHIRNPFQRDNFVVVTAITLLGLIGVQEGLRSFSHLLLPTTAVALGVPLWLLAGRLPLYRQRLVLQSLGTVCLLGWPLTPAGPLLSRWIGFSGGMPNGFAVLGAWAFSTALWLPLFQNRADDRTPLRGWLRRAWAGIALLALPLAVFGMAPALAFDLVHLQTPAIFRVPLAQQLAQAAGYLLLTGVGGLGSAYVLAHRKGPGHRLATRFSSLCSLEWLSGGIQFSSSRLSLIWVRALTVLEGPGVVGWGLTLSLLLWAVLQ